MRTKLDAARLLPSDPTVRAIAERAGVTSGLVVHHFGTKAALRDARRARGGSKRRLEQVTPAVGASAVEERTDGDQKVLPYLVEEMPR